MFTAAELVAFVISMIGMPYWYGCCVYRCTESLRARKAKQYPSHYKNSRTATYRKHIAAKLICMDCVGMIKGFFWTNGGKDVAAAIGNDNPISSKYGGNGMPDKSASGLLKWLKSKGCKNGKIDSLPDVPGILLFSPGHVGVYVGGGEAVEARGFNYGVVRTKVKNRKWTEWAYLPKSLLKYDSAPDSAPVIVPDKPASSTACCKLGERLLKLKSPYMTGDDVEEMQTHLNHLGYDCGTADGVFGKKTRDGVKAFQRNNGLTVDGEFGPKSFAKLTTLIQPVQNPPEPVEPVEPVEPENPGTVYPIHGFIPDVSAYQGNIDMDKFVAGNDFAILRARVNGKDDSKFKTWAAELQKRNFPFAVYDYLRLKSEDDAIKQADAMFTACHPFNPRIYYLDTEELADGMTYDKERELIKIYVQRLRDWGVELVGQYTGDYRWRTQYKSLNGIFDTLWIANWGSNNGSYEGITLKSAAYTDKIHLHQFTSYGYTKVPGSPGINHRVDLNRLTGVVPLAYFTGRNHGEPVVENRTYTVQPKDTLWGIAKRIYGKGNRYKDIMTANQMTSTVIHAGMVLVIPA